MKQARRRGHFTFILAAISVVVVAAGAVGLAMRNGGKSESGGQSDLFIVRTGEFEISLPVSGELAALQQIEVRNRLEKQAIITEIVEEGKWVNTGDVLLKLNDEELRNQVKDEIDEVNVAEAEAIAAASELDITIKERESELAKADLAIRLAELALQGWKEGEDKSKRLELSLALETAQKNSTRLKDRFTESAGLLEKKFISLDEFKQDEIAMIEANAKLQQAELDIQVYEKYEYLQEKATKESDLEQAVGERQRTEQSFDAKVRSAQSELDSKKYQLQSKKERLRLKEQQLTYCTVTAPSPGLVVYYASLESGNRWGGDGPPQIGTQLHPNETVIVLPDTTKMVAAVKVSETLSGSIKVGQRATVTSDAIPDRTLYGEVISVGVLAESGGWRDPNRRDYTVKILLEDGQDLGLKPAMRCKANIYVGRIENALHMPVQAVFRTASVPYVYVPDGGGYSQRKVTLGKSSELFIEIIDGLAEGDTVLLREPAPEEVVSRIEVPRSAPGSGGRGPRGPRGADGREGGPRRGGDGDRDGDRGDADATEQTTEESDDEHDDVIEPEPAGGEQDTETDASNEKSTDAAGAADASADAPAARAGENTEHSAATPN